MNITTESPFARKLERGTHSHSRTCYSNLGSLRPATPTLFAGVTHTPFQSPDNTTAPSVCGTGHRTATH